MAKSTKVSKAVKEFIDPPSTKLQDWNWRPLEAVSKDLNLTEIPDYIQKGYGSFMADQAARAAAGDLTSRDLLKAYLITQSSIGRQGRSYNTATKAGLKVPRTDELVRPEGAFAAWLGSKSGQRYLDAAMKGELDKKAVAEIQSQFAPFGKQNVLGKAMVGAVDMVPKMAPTLNQSIMGLPDDYRDYAEQLKGIAAAKSGFVGSLLGRGDLPTFDARQIYLHTAGQPLPTKIPESILDRGKGLGGREAVDRLAARQDALGLKLDPALDPYYQHLAHHAVWDKSGGSQTTHQDLIDAMTNYKDGGPVHMLGGGLSVFDQPTEDELAAARKAAYGRQRMSGAGVTRPEAEELEEREQAVVKAYEPTWKQQIDAGLQAGLRKLGSPSNRARQLSGVMSGHNPVGIGAIDFVPFLGTAVGIEESGRAAMEDLRQGDALGAALSIGLGVVPGAYSTIKATPGATRALKGAVRRGQSEIDRGLVGQGSLANLMDVDANKARLMLREGPGRAPLDLSPDAMRIKAWDKKIKGKAAGGQVQHMAKGRVAKGLSSSPKQTLGNYNALPLQLPVSKYDEKRIIELAERYVRQQMGEHVIPKGSDKTVNLAGQSMKEAERLKGVKYNLAPTKSVQPSNKYESKVGDVNIALPGDISIADQVLLDVNGLPINSVQQGGPLYGLGQSILTPDQRAFWASAEQAAQGFQNKVTDLANLFGTNDIYAHHLAMGKDAMNFAQHFADANLKAIHSKGYTPEAAERFNSVMRAGTKIRGKQMAFPDWPGLDNPDLAYEAMKNNPELRKFFNDRMKVPEFTQSLGLPNGLDIQHAISEPDMRNMEINLTGKSIGRMKPGADLMDELEHNTYAKKILGESVGHAENLVPMELRFRDANAYIADRQPSSYVTGTMQKIYPHQVVDQQSVDEIGLYNDLVRMMRGYNKGGAVHMAEGGQSRQPVDRSLPDLGSEERLRMEDYLRRMRFTGGGSGDKYGTGVGGRAMMNFPVGPVVVQPYVGGGVYKPQGGKLTGGVSEAGVNLVVPFADGGEVSADDLIVEERPL